MTRMTDTRILIKTWMVVITYLTLTTIVMLWWYYHYEPPAMRTLGYDELLIRDAVWIAYGATGQVACTIWAKVRERKRLDVSDQNQ